MKKIATRESYGNALKELGEQYQDVVVLDADLSGATKTVIFKEAHPNRFFNAGIAEQNMIGMAAGMATTGLVPFASSFAMFTAGRAYEQIRNSVGYPRLNVKIGATHGGVSVGEDGASHQCCEDFALMRVIPGMVVLCPADDIEARAVVKAAYEHKGPVYMRFARSASPVFHSEDYQFEIGKGELLREGKDVTIVVTGILGYEVLEAAKSLAEVGVEAEVINMASIKPLDKEMILNSAKKTGKVVTVEEHSIIGGLGEAVSSLLVEECPCVMKRIGMCDIFGHSGKDYDLLKEFKLTAPGILEQVNQFLEKN